MVLQNMEHTFGYVLFGILFLLYNKMALAQALIEKVSSLLTIKVYIFCHNTVTHVCPSQQKTTKINKNFCESSISVYVYTLSRLFS